MKNLILLIFLVFGSTGIFAQTTKDTAPLSPALQEAEKTSREVVALFNQKKYEEALPLARRVIEIREKESGKTHLTVGQAWRNLAYIQQQRGKLDEARKAFENTLAIYEANLPLGAADEKVFAELLDVVATYQANDGEFEKAEKKLQRSLELREKFYGKDALEVGGLLVKLAQISQFTGEYDKAVPLSRRALEISAAKLGATNDRTRDVYNIAYCSLTKLGDEAGKNDLRDKYFPPKSKDDSSTEGNVPLTIRSGIVNGKAISLPKPPYPSEAILKRAQGTVQVQVTVDETGKVVFACAISGEKVLHRASETAAYNSKFAPTTLEGKPVRITGVIVYNFVRGTR